MKNILSHIFVIGALAMGIFSCTNNDNSTGYVSVPLNSNLILNPYFQINGDTSLTYWMPNYYNWSVNHFLSDTPSGGHLYTLILYGGGESPGEEVNATVPIAMGTHQYIFSFWSKGKGYIAIRRSDSTSTSNIFYSINDSIWNHYLIQDTITSVSSDHYTITLSANAGAGPLSPPPAYFNSPSFERVN